MNALAELVLDRSGSRSRIVHVPYEEAYAEGFEDVERRIPDIGKIGRVVGWQPKLDLDRIVTDVIASDRRALEGFDASSTPNAR
jgi:UDP-glucose 4-epimerase